MGIKFWELAARVITPVMAVAKTPGEENAKAKIVKEALRQKRGRSPRKNALHVSMQTSQADISNMHRMSRKGEEGDALGNQSKRKEQDKHQLQMHTHAECVS